MFLSIAPLRFPGQLANTASSLIEKVEVPMHYIIMSIYWINKLIRTYKPIQLAQGNMLILSLKDVIAWWTRPQHFLETSEVCWPRKNRNPEYTGRNFAYFEQLYGCLCPIEGNSTNQFMLYLHWATYCSLCSTIK